MENILENFLAENYFTPFVFVTFFLLSSCSSKDSTNGHLQEKSGTIYTHMEDGILVTKFHDNFSPKKVYWLNPAEKKEGFAYSYHENGLLGKKNFWENGQKAGEELVYNNRGVLIAQKEFQKGLPTGEHLFWEATGSLKKQVLFSEGNVIYEAHYKEGRKENNLMYPQVVESFLFEDKYYAKIHFHLDFEGEMNISIKNSTDYYLSEIEDKKYQIVINHALDLATIEMEMEYTAHPQDTLVNNKYSFTHVIFED